MNKDNIDNSKYPFNIKCLRNFNELKIDNSVTLLYEENEVYKIYKDFLSNPYGMQKILFEE